MITVIGIDPGDTAAILLAGWDRGERQAAHVHAYQCDGRSAQGLLRMITHVTNHVTAAQIEAFDDRPGVRGLKGTSAARIRNQVLNLRLYLEECGIPVYVRQASEVKTWATEDRLAKAGLIEATRGMPKHARDAGRHALFCAVRDCGIPDPLSRARAVST